MLLTAALGLLAGTALATPAPGGLMKTPLSQQDLALLGAGVLALLAENMPGRNDAKLYGFASTLTHPCGPTYVGTYTLGPIVDSDYHVVQDGHDSPVSSNRPGYVYVFGTKLSIEIDGNTVSYEYGALRWNSTQLFRPGDDFSCLASGWSNAVSCNESDSSDRSQDMFCVLWDKSGKHGKSRPGDTNASVASVAPSIETQSAEDRSKQIPSYPSGYLEPGPVSPSTVPEVMHGLSRHAL
ncbi:uncharacterized protein EKO05_0005509 [Ascochyta rabiei]|uniref:Uncharacterized protein n=1 Tax=Didymella rabiei TaxID=5454 RepID=A0A163JNW6_DIDRA|nr:uncharacterized protein EKO05_0005509 [Ascochyta rabiei]KZM26481.1 hypothetical protein ST47_g2360 [Ascochyta rabiei]UPX15043.1 hypothetical protein EKO05_0005509 [Ascochyta rabiei]